MLASVADFPTQPSPVGTIFAEGASDNASVTPDPEAGAGYPIAHFASNLVDLLIKPGSAVNLNVEPLDSPEAHRHEPGLKYMLTELLCHGVVEVPLRVRMVHIDKVDVKIPLAALRDGLFEVVVDGVDVLLELQPVAEWDVNASRNLNEHRIHKALRKLVESHEAVASKQRAQTSKFNVGRLRGNLIEYVKEKVLTAASASAL